MSRTADPQKKSGRTTFVLPEELEARVRKIAPLLGHSFNSCVVQAVEASMDAAESNETALESPIIERWRATLGKQTFGANLFKKVCELFEPANTAEMTEWHWNYFCELLKKHEGPLDRKTRDLYWNQAKDMNQLREAREKELAKIKKQTSDGK